MQKIKYISNRDLLLEIQRSKATYCHFLSPEYNEYDVIVTSVDDITPLLVMTALQAKMVRLAKAQGGVVAQVAPDAVVFRVMSDRHLPPEQDEKRRKKSSTGEWVAKTNFPPFRHYIVRDNVPIEVGRSHWRGDLDDGAFSAQHGCISDRLAGMFMLMVDRYSRGGNWRGYCVDEATEALTQRGWLGINEITTDDIILSFDDGRLKWSKIKSIFRDDYDGKMHKLTVTGMDALVTPRHKFMTERGLIEVEHLVENDRIILTENLIVPVESIDFHGGKRNDQPNEPTFDYKGRVWCPETEYGSFMARRNGSTYLSGNTYVDEMRSHALVQLSQVGLQFDESRSDNPFAFYTQIVKNCLGGDTMILTREFGSVSIEQVSEQDVHLLDGNGDWVKCHIYDYGMQETVNLNFFGDFSQISVRSTAEHGWIQKGTSERINTKHFVERNGYATKEVLIDDLRPSKSVGNEVEYRRGVIHGLIYGDGSAAPNRENFFFMRLCSEKVELETWFADYPNAHPPSSNGDPTYYLARTWCNLKALPVNPGISLDYLMGFVRGWLATDGCVSTEGDVTICGDESEYQWLKKWGPLIGWHVNSFTPLPEVTNYGIRNKKSGNAHLKKQSMDVGDFLRTKHRERFADVIKRPKQWRVYPGNKQTFEKRMERVYCPDVPTTHSFALASGIHTMNCFRRILNLERRNQDIRDDLLIMSGAQPSYTRQIDNEFDQRDENQKAVTLSTSDANVTGRGSDPEASLIRKRRGRKPKVPIE